MHSVNKEQRLPSEPYLIICPNCNEAMEFPQTSSESPLTCPFCHQIISDNYEIRYQPSKKSRLFQMIALGILITLGILILLAAAVWIIRKAHS